MTARKVVEQHETVQWVDTCTQCGTEFQVYCGCTDTICYKCVCKARRAKLREKFAYLLNATVSELVFDEAGTCVKGLRLLAKDGRTFEAGAHTDYDGGADFEIEEVD